MSKSHARTKLDHSDPTIVQQLFNALTPDSYVPPHRHLGPGKEETLLMQRGSVGLILFDDAGKITQCTRLVAGGDDFGVHIPIGVWHSVVALTPCVFFEVKQGPYTPLSDAERATWAPPEAAPDAMSYLQWMQAQFSPS